jgi:Zn-dependent protease with chaperone function
MAKKKSDKAGKSKKSGAAKDDARIVLPEISAAAWEHPSDRVALNALQALPGFDTVLRLIARLFGEKSGRLLFQANAIRVSENQYGWIHERLERVCEVLAVEKMPELYVSQTPLVNAGAIGIDQPFIVLNSSLLEIMDRDQVEFVIAHEVGHIRSGHALYRTVMFLLLRLSATRYPIAGVAIRPILMALLEWSRKAEMSCDRAGLLGVQDPTVAMGALMAMAGGARGEDLDLDEFIAQAEEYRHDGDLLDTIYKQQAMLGRTHPFTVARVAALRDWIDSGDYETILGGEYRTWDEHAETNFGDDLGDAASDLTERAKATGTKLVDKLGGTVTKAGSAVGEAWRTGSADS